MSEVYNANVRVRDLPVAVDRALGDLASRYGMLKWEIVRQALIEYVEKHTNAAD